MNSLTPVCTDEASHVGSRSDDYSSAFLWFSAPQPLRLWTKLNILVCCCCSSWPGLPEPPSLRSKPKKHQQNLVRADGCMVICDMSHVLEWTWSAPDVCIYTVLYDAFVSDDVLFSYIFLYLLYVSSSLFYVSIVFIYHFFFRGSMVPWHADMMKI